MVEGVALDLDRGASMGPRLFRRGNVYPRYGRMRGNGLQWGHVFSDVEIHIVDILTPPSVGLQWGHVFSDVEIVIPSERNLLASMLQWGHVFSDVEISSVRSIFVGMS